MCVSHFDGDRSKLLKIWISLRRFYTWRESVFLTNELRHNGESIESWMVIECHIDLSDSNKEQHIGQNSIGLCGTRQIILPESRRHCNADRIKLAL